MSKIVYEMAFDVVNCATCCMAFAVPARFLLDRQRDHKSFYCPFGHSHAYQTESDIERVKREKDEAERNLQSQLSGAKHAQLVAERERDKAIKAKRAVEKRVAHGVCPCCNKTFADLSNHMVTEHKDFRLPAGKQTKQITGVVQ